MIMGKFHTRKIGDEEAKLILARRREGATQDDLCSEFKRGSRSIRALLIRSGEPPQVKASGPVKGVQCQNMQAPSRQASRVVFVGFPLEQHAEKIRQYGADRVSFR